MTMWNIARYSVLQLESDADAAEAVVAVALEVSAANRVDCRGVECRIATGAHDFGVGGCAAARGDPVAHDGISLDALPLGGRRIELLRVNGSFESRATLSGRSVLGELGDDLAVHRQRGFVLRLVHVAQDQPPSNFGSDEHP